MSSVLDAVESHPVSGERGVPRATLAGPAFARAREALLPLRGDELGFAAAESLGARIPELGTAADREWVLRETAASCGANIDEIIRLLTTGRPASEYVLPPAAVDFARGLVQRNVPLSVLLRAYRVGHEWFWDVMMRRLSGELDGDPGLVAAERVVSAFTFAYVDLVSDAIVEAYHVERDRWVRTSAAVRAETARELLGDDGLLDEQVASARLGYELSRFHVAAVLTSGAAREGGLETLERLAAELGERLGTGDALIVPAGRAVVWAWYGSHRALDDAALADSAVAADVHVGVGRVGRGVEGFRVSHGEARHAVELAALGGRSMAGVTRYETVELVSLVTADIERARRFVRGQLGPLAADDEASEALRETLLAFLAQGESYIAAAQALGIHKNTVYTRVRRVEGVLGRPVAARRAELQAALLLTRTLGSRVLG